VLTGDPLIFSTQWIMTTETVSRESLFIKRIANELPLTF